jgi:tRNA-5-taurinomethyluridine 2-sulfurtransferase
MCLSVGQQIITRTPIENRKPAKRTTHSKLQTRWFSERNPKKTSATMTSLFRSNGLVRRKIGVALSGGVDSSVAAYLLLQQRPSPHNNVSGHDNLVGGSGGDQVVGIHMSNWDFRQEDGESEDLPDCLEQEWKDAQAVAQHLKIPIVHTNFTSDYWNHVFEPYVDALGNRNNKNNHNTSRSSGATTTTQHDFMASSTTRTPNPDVDCNRFIKFGVLKEYVFQRLQCDYLATGHYARLWDPTTSTTCTSSSSSRNQNSSRRNQHQYCNTDMPDCLHQALDEDPSLDFFLDPTVPTLLVAADASKDQSYFLSSVPGLALSHVLFPLGELQKKKTNEPHHYGDQLIRTVRDIAREAQLPTAGKQESMGICFIGKRRRFGEFVHQYIPPPVVEKSVSQESDDEDNDRPNHSTSHKTTPHGAGGVCINVEDGSIVGTFDPTTSPLVYATIGQGAKLSGATQKWFVVDKTHGNRTIHVCLGTHHPALYADRLYMDQLHWISKCPTTISTTAIRAKCRIRHLQPLVDCEIRPRRQRHDSGEDYYEVVLDQPLRGIAPGQVAVFYVGRDGLICIGGGPIAQRGLSYFELGQELPIHNLHPAGHNDLSLRSYRKGEEKDRQIQVS